MAHPETVSNVQQDLDVVVAQILETQQKVDASRADYQNAVVTGSTSVGTDGGSLEGNIHYTRGGQIYFHLEGAPTGFWGLYATPIFVPLLGCLPEDQLAGKTGTFKMRTGIFGGSLQMWLDGQPVFREDINLPPGYPSGLEGRVSFKRP